MQRIGERMKNIDRPADIQSASIPVGHRRSRVDADAIHDIGLTQRIRGIPGDGRLRGNVRERSPVGSSELECAVRMSHHRITVLMHRTVMPATEQHQIRERRRSPVRPVLDVVALTDADFAPREATPVVPVLQRPS